MTLLKDPDYYSRERVEARKKEQRRQRQRKDLLVFTLIAVLGVGTFGFLRLVVAGEGGQQPTTPTGGSPGGETAGVKPTPSPTTSLTSHQADGIAAAMLNNLLEIGPDAAQFVAANVEQVTGCDVRYANAGRIDTPEAQRIFARETKQITSHIPGAVVGQVKQRFEGVLYGLTVGVLC